jgi:hypothetical protein
METYPLKHSILTETLSHSLVDLFMMGELTEEDVEFFGEVFDKVYAHVLQKPPPSLPPGRSNLHLQGNTVWFRRTGKQFEYHLAPLHIEYPMTSSGVNPFPSSINNVTIVLVPRSKAKVKPKEKKKAIRG